MSNRLVAEVLPRVRRAVREREAICGRPMEGHLTIASFSWWMKAFEAGG